MSAVVARRLAAVVVVLAASFGVAGLSVVSTPATAQVVASGGCCLM